MPAVPPVGDKALSALIALAVVGSVLCVGAVHLPILLGLSVISTAAYVLSRRLTPGPWPLPARIAFALAGFTLLQSIPLPLGLLARVAPDNADVWARALAPLGASGPRWAPVSLDPGASLIVAFKWITYAFLFVAASSLGERRGNRLGVAIVFVSAVIAGLTTVAHGLLGAERVFGLYQPDFQPAPWHLGPLLNPNNLAGYLNLGAVCGLGFLVARRSSVPRWLVGAGIAIVIAVEITSASRAGMVALPMGVLLFGFTVSWRRRRDASDAVRAVGRRLVLAAVAGGLVLGVLAATTSTWREIWDKNVEKLDLLRFVVPMVRAHLWLGVGPGAFETAFPAYRDAPGNVVYRHAENFVADWAAGWGIPTAAIALVAFAWALRPSAVGARRSTVAAAAWAAAFAVFAQNLVDLGLEVPAVMVAVTVVLGSLWGANVARREPGRDARNGRAWRSWRAGAAAGAVFLLGAACVRWGWSDAESDRRELHARLGSLRTDAASRAAFRNELRAAMLRHPAEPYFPLLGAVLAWRARDNDPVPWLSRALERDPTNGRAHLLLADVLVSRRAIKQALMELRLAVQGDGTLAPNAARRAVAWTQDCELIERAAPEGPSRATMLAALGEAMGHHAADTGCQLRLLRQAISGAPREMYARGVLAGILLAHYAKGRDDGVCGGELRAGCERELEAIAQALEAETPSSSAGLRIRARLLRMQGQPERAADLLAGRCFKVSDKTDCLRSRLEAAVEVQTGEDLQGAISEYLGASCHGAAACAEANATVGSLLVSRRFWSMAVTYFEKAAHDDPTEARWLALADAATRAGEHAHAVSALEKVAYLRGGADSGLRARIDEERRRMLSP